MMTKEESRWPAKHRETTVSVIEVRASARARVRNAGDERGGALRAVHRELGAALRDRIGAMFVHTIMSSLNLWAQRLQ